MKIATNYSPRIALEAKKRKQDSAYRIWLVLRSIDRYGRGVAIDELRAKLQPIMGRLSFDSYVEKMTGIFWRVSKKGKIYHRSAEKLAVYYGMTNIGAVVAPIFVETILGTSLPLFRAIVFFDWFGSCIRMNRQISQVEIRRLTGISPASQKRYRKLLKRAGYTLEAEHNFEPIAEVSASDVTEAKYICDDIAAATGKAPAIITDTLGEYGKAGALYLAFRLPNSYIAKGFTRLYSGRSQHINRTLRTQTVVTCQKRGVGPSTDETERKKSEHKPNPNRPIKNQSARHVCKFFLPHGDMFYTGVSV